MPTDSSNEEQIRAIDLGAPVSALYAFPSVKKSARGVNVES